jgi:hypothetical protein
MRLCGSPAFRLSPFFASGMEPRRRKIRGVGLQRKPQPGPKGDAKALFPSALSTIASVGAVHGPKGVREGV